MHLVLPPAPAPSAPAPAPAPSVDSPVPTPTQEAAGLPINPMQQNPFSTHGQFAMRGSRPESSEVDPEIVNRIQAIRRRVEQITGGRNQARPTSQASATTTSSDTFSSHVASLFPQQAPEQRLSGGFSNPSISASPRQSPLSTTTTTSTLQFRMPSNTSTARSSVANSEVSDLTDSQQLRLQILRHQISLGEDQLSRGIAPPFDHIIRMRTQLFQILDDQYRNPLARRDGTVESLLTRVFNMYTRADQLRVMQTRSTASLQSNLSTSSSNADPSAAPLYLLSSPQGYQGLVVPPNGAETIQASIRAAQTPGPTQTQGAGNVPDAQANLNAALMENVVRQAVLNQRLNNNTHQLSLARTIRRMWLFVRLYFFCYMFSEPGTWTRVLFVCFAVICSLLSDTGVPQQLYGTFLAPVQRHFERVIDQHPQPRQPAAMGPTTHPRDGPRGGLWNSIRQAERSLVFFMTSLVPGISERYIAVTTQRAREEEEENRRRQEEAERAGEADQRHSQDGNNAHSHPAQDATTASETHPTIPQDDDAERG